MQFFLSFLFTFFFLTPKFTYVVTICNFEFCYKRRAIRACGSFPLCTKCRSQTNEHSIRPGNETSCAHAYKIRKWRLSQRTATTGCCEWLLLTRVNLRL